MSWFEAKAGQNILVMVALWNRADHHIFALWFLLLLSSFFFSSPNLSRRRLDVCHRPYFHTWCGLSANLECRSEMCCTRLAEIQDAKSRQKSTSGHHRSICRAISSQLRHVSTIRKKNLLSSNMSTCPHNMVNFGLLAAEIG